MAKKQINLALQGGGAHGAFTWGVLDTLLMDNRVEIGAISGTSAGAMNAVLVADGLVHGGPEKACQKLEDFWLAVSDAAKSSPIRRSPLDVLMNNWSLDNSPGFFMMDMMSRMLTPQQMNPLKLNPLRDILVEHVDFDNVCGCNVMQIFISATNVETGRVKVFDRTTLDADKVMASACLPFMFEPVEIDGEYYYDGGYMGNPALLPLNSATDIRDLLVVQINPVCRPGVPKTAAEIMNRVNEITFNSSLLKELRALDFIARLTEEGELDSPNISRCACIFWKQPTNYCPWAPVQNSMPSAHFCCICAILAALLPKNGWPKTMPILAKNRLSMSAKCSRIPAWVMKFPPAPNMATKKPPNKRTIWAMIAAQKPDKRLIYEEEHHVR